MSDHPGLLMMIWNQSTTSQQQYLRQLIRSLLLEAKKLQAVFSLLHSEKLLIVDLGQEDVPNHFFFSVLSLTVKL